MIAPHSLQLRWYGHMSRQHAFITPLGKPGVTVAVSFANGPWVIVWDYLHKYKHRVHAGETWNKEQSCHIWNVYKGRVCGAHALWLIENAVNYLYQMVAGIAVAIRWLCQHFRKFIFFHRLQCHSGWGAGLHRHLISWWWLLYVFYCSPLSNIPVLINFYYKSVNLSAIL